MHTFLPNVSDIAASTIVFVVDVFVCLFCWNCTEFHYFILVIPNCGWCWVQHKWLFANWQFLNTLSVHRSERNGLDECGMVERRNQSHRQAIARAQNENGTFCIVYNCITYHHRFKEREKSWQRRKGRAKKTNERTKEAAAAAAYNHPQWWRSYQWQFFASIVAHGVVSTTLDLTDVFLPSILYCIRHYITSSH